MTHKTILKKSIVLGAVIILFSITIFTTLQADIYIPGFSQSKGTPSDNNLFDNIIFGDNESSNTTIVQIIPENTNVDPSSTFTIGVYCEPAQPVKSYELNIGFNGSLLQATLVQQGNIFSNFTSLFNAGTINNTAGEIRNIYELIMGTGNVTEPGYLVNITFNSLSINATTQITLTNAGMTNETHYVPLTIINGSVQIGALENLPITLTQETPTNNSANFSINQNLVSINITDPESSLINWTIQGPYIQNTGQNSDTSGIKTATVLTPLPYNSSIIWFVNGTDGVIFTNRSYSFTTREQYVPASPSNFSTTPTSTTMIHLNWTQAPHADRTYIEFNTTSSWNRGEGTILCNDTATEFSQSGLNPHTQYFYQAWGYNDTDKVYSISYSTNNSTTLNTYPILGMPNPTNGSTNQPLMLNWTIMITDEDNDTFDWNIECSNGQNNNGFNESNGIKQLNLINLQFNTLYTIWVNVTDGFDTVNEWYTFFTQPVSEPDIPLNFTATTVNTTSIQLNWTLGLTADKTYIEYNTYSTWNRGEGIVIYNDSGISTIHTNLNGHTQYFYQAWSYNDTGSIYSLSYASTNATTENTPPVHGTPNPTNGSISQPLTLTWSIMITDADNDLFNWSIHCSNGQSNSNSYDNNGLKQLNLNNLINDTTYIIWVNSTDGVDTLRTWYQFTTRSYFEPEQPTLFTATASTTDQIDLEWTKGTNTDTTYVEYNVISLWNLGEGTLVYNDTGIAVSHTGLNPHTRYYYQAWGYNQTSLHYSSTYASDSDTTLNNPPVYGTPNPLNQSTNQPTNLSWTISITDADGDLLTWTITANNGQQNSQTNDVSGTKSLTLTNLIPNTTYTIWVNTTDSIDITTHYYTFTTEPVSTPDLIVSANVDKTIAAIGETLQFSASASGGIPPYQWQWDFDDGATSNTQNPTHVYTTIGLYDAVLTVTDSVSTVQTDTIQIQIINPLIIICEGPYSATLGESIEFNVTVQGGTPGYQYLWDFGDGTQSTNKTQVHTFTNPGVYDITLTVKDSLNIQATYSTTATIFTNQLFVDINGPYEGTAKEAVQFSSSVSNGVSPYIWSWNFGDGTGSSVEQNPSYTYSDDGNYTVTLTVTDYLGTSKTETTFALIEKPPFLTLDIGGPYNSVVNDPVDFTLTILDGKRPYTILWDFGDGTTSNEENPSHSYSIPGQYVVTVRVTDDDNRIGEEDTTVDIDQNYPPAKPTISGTFRGTAGDRYTYTIKTNDPDGDYVYYLIDWGDGTDSGWIGPYTSGRTVEISHVWQFEDSYLVKVKAKDTYGAESGWTTNEITMPKAPNGGLLETILEHLLQRFPLLEPMVQFIYHLLII